MDRNATALGNEPVFTGDEVIARVTSGGIGFSVSRSIAYAYLPPDLADPGTTLSLEVFGERIGAEVALDPLFDPTGDRIRG